MDPELVRRFVAKFTAEWNKAVAEIDAGAAAKRSDLRGTERKIANQVDAISDGLRSPELKQRLADLEARKASLEAVLSRGRQTFPALHPSIAEVYREEITRLRHELSADDTNEALEASRRLIDRVVISPRENDDDPPGDRDRRGTHRHAPSGQRRHPDQW